MTDEENILQITDGGTDMPEVLYERYGNALFVFCAGMLKDPDTARDIVQETFSIFLQEYKNIRDYRSVKSWLFTTARNQVYAHFKKRRKFQSLDGESEQIFSAEPDPVESNERIEIVRKMIDRLLPQYKEVLMLREYHMMHYEAIAEVTGSTISSVKSKLFKARKALQDQLQPYINERAI
jgi:RNA polymerase sigma-70 factor (ECF subfamily)